MGVDPQIHAPSKAGLEQAFRGYDYRHESFTYTACHKKRPPESVSAEPDRVDCPACRVGMIAFYQAKIATANAGLYMFAEFNSFELTGMDVAAIKAQILEFSKIIKSLTPIEQAS